MALVTSPPVLIDAVSQTAGGGAYPETIYGPFEYNGKLYMLLQNTSATYPHLAWFKSADKGFTWSPLSPAGASVNTGNGSYSCYRSGNTVYVTSCDVTDTNKLKLGTFDLTAESWGATLSTLPMNGNVTGAVPEGNIFVCPNGNLLYMCHQALPTFNDPTKVYFTLFSGGSWSAPALVSTNIAAGVVLEALCMDASGNVHSWYTDPATQNLYHNQVSQTGVIGTPALVLANHPKPYSAGGSYAGLAVEFQGKLYLPVFGTGALLSIIVGSPSIAPTVWTVQSTAFQIPQPQAMTYHATRLLVSGSTLYAVWQNYQQPGGAGTNPTVDEIDYATSTDGVTWSASTVLYNEVTNPQTTDNHPQNLQFVHNVSAAVLSTGQIGLSSRLENNTGCVSYYYPYSITPAAPQSAPSPGGPPKTPSWVSTPQGPEPLPGGGPLPQPRPESWQPKRPQQSFCVDRSGRVIPIGEICD